MKKMKTNSKSKKRKNVSFQKIGVWCLLLVFVGVTLIEIMSAFFAPKSYAADIESYESSEITMTFTLEEAINYAKENNKDIALLKLQQSGLMYSLSENNASVKKYNDQIDELLYPGSTVSLAASSSFETYLLKSNYYGTMLKANKELTEKSTKVQEELLPIFVEKCYNEVLIKELEYEDAKRNFDVVKKQLETGLIKFNYGNISEVAYKTLELELNSAEISVLNAQKALADSKNEFKEKLGLNLDVDVELTSKLEIEEKEIQKSEEKENEIIEKSLSLLAAKTQLTLAEEQAKYAKAYYGKSNASAKTYIVKASTAKIDYDNAKNSIEKAIANTYTNIDIMKKTLDLMSKRVDLMNTVLGLTNIRKEVGMATESDMIKASIDYNSAKCEYLEMLSSYNIIVEMFDMNIVN